MWTTEESLKIFRQVTGLKQQRWNSSIFQRYENTRGSSYPSGFDHVRRWSNSIITVEPYPARREKDRRSQTTEDWLEKYGWQKWLFPPGYGFHCPDGEGGSRLIIAMPPHSKYNPHWDMTELLEKMPRHGTET